MNRNALVIHGNKCTSSIFILMLRFGGDFLWISLSKWTVRFGLCLAGRCPQASPSQLGTAPVLPVYLRWFRKHFSGVLFPLCIAENQFGHTHSFIQIKRSKIVCQTLKKPTCLRLNSLVLYKEGLPVSPRAASGHTGKPGGAAQHHFTPTPLPGSPCPHCMG